MKHQPREVYIAADPVNAEIAKDMLASHGIAAHVRRQYLWGGMGQLPADVYPGVWVDDDGDYQAARRLIESFERGPVASASPWFCPSCGERLDGQFTTCWSCQTPRPAE
ncbi:MAG: DUF2007 domain-containing protein [Salinisphaera sp.]|jgi:hypothetical protein|nr:DUF2007 domain-containing protein [Salinisphaera sp.]